MCADEEHMRGAHEHTRAQVLVAHRLSTVINAHTIVVVDKGRAAEQGNHHQLLERDGTYAALVAHQVQKQRATLSDAPEATADAASGKKPSYGDGIDALFDRSAKTGGGNGEGSSSAER
jgi:ABC-type sugar transport system ATPase subunit